jgi:hypothetical protein
MKIRFCKNSELELEPESSIEKYAIKSWIEETIGKKKVAEIHVMHKPEQREYMIFKCGDERI